LETKDERLMRLALKLAEKGRGKTSPNPMVGAVVVKKGKVLAKGYHRKFGAPHAEAIAIEACGDSAKGTTLYATLEPCCHFGNTPPCTDLIIEKGISRVVCATIDPNPQVNGKGLERLKKRGIKVSLGILGQEAEKLNEVYFKYITTRLPFVTLKLVQTLDGRTVREADSSGIRRARASSKLILSNEPWMDAILCDANTGATDFIAARLSSSNSAKPRVILLGTRREITSKLKKLRRDVRKDMICVPTDHERLEGEPKTWKIETKKGGGIDLRSLLMKAGEEGITSLLVEGGNRMATRLLKMRLVDKMWCFISPEIRGKGEESLGDLGTRRIRDAINLKNCEFKQLKDGLLVVGCPAEVRS
jgi:diaminohydroxyphosphoribosylaminopyrimidine deaminase/5-amino-6-(5-phosphoribosylamino)uracil reductase